MALYSAMIPVIGKVASAIRRRFFYFSGKETAVEQQESTIRLRALRLERGLRQIDISGKTGIDQRTRSNYETGKTRPDSKALIALADFYGVSIDYLVGRTVSQNCDSEALLQKLIKINTILTKLDHCDECLK